MKELITDTISIAVGFVAIFFRKRFAREIIEAQKSTPWGSNYGDKEVKISEIVIIVVGIGFIAFGINLFLTSPK